MGNRLDNLATEQLNSEDFDFEGILDTFKKSLQPREGEICASYDEVQEALWVFLIHMQAMHPPYVISIRNTLRLYNKCVMDSEEKDEFIGLQGYIRYIEWHILEPLEKEAKKWDFKKDREELLLTIESTKKNIIFSKKILQEMKATQARIDSLLKTGPENHIKLLLDQERLDGEALIKEMEKWLQKSENDLLTLTGKRN